MSATTITTNELAQGGTTPCYGQQHIVQDSSGNLYAAYLDASSGQPYVAISTDSGATWSTDHSWASYTSPYFLSMTIDNSGNVFLCFISSTTTINVWKRTAGGGSWAQSLQVTGANTTQAMLTHHISSDYVSLVRLDSGSGVTGYASLYYYNGTSWSSAVTLNSPVNISNNYNVLCGITINQATGKIYIMLHNNYISYTISFYSFSYLGTSTNLEGSNSISAPLLGGCVCTDTANNRWYFIYKGTGSSYALNVYKNEGASTSYSDTATYTTDGVLHGELAIGSDTSSNIYCFFTRGSDGCCYTFKYTAATLSWSATGSYTNYSGAGVVGNRPSCMQLAPVGGAVLPVLYTSTV